MICFTFASSSACAMVLLNQRNEENPIIPASAMFEMAAKIAVRLRAVLPMACDRSYDRHMTGGQRKIRILRPPIGGAPDWVRQAWVGLELPVVPGARSRAYLAFDVLGGPRSRLGNLLGLLRGKAKPMTGYPVYAGRAVELLAASSPDAASWWREHAPYLPRPGRMFVFNEDACSPLIER